MYVLSREAVWSVQPGKRTWDMVAPAKAKRPAGPGLRRARGWLVGAGVVAAVGGAVVAARAYGDANEIYQEAEASGHKTRAELADYDAAGVGVALGWSAVGLGAAAAGAGIALSVGY